MKIDIDFVITWVDGSDPLWLEEFKRFHSIKADEDTRDIRYRDWELLNYWFRAVECFAPWVRKIHFVTWGHVPEWLNQAHPKINVVNHCDYMPNSYTPVFNSRPIELNLHHIKDLSENFVLFNDDMFLSKVVYPQDFFVKNLPCDFAILNAHAGGDITSVVMNDIRLINKEFQKMKVIRSNPFKWFNYKYKFRQLQTLLLLPWKRFTGFVDPHQPQPFNKQTFIETWELYSNEMDATSRNRFRCLSGLNQYYLRYRQLVTGKFHPHMRKSKMFFLKEGELNEISEAFKSKKYHTVCLNDMSETSNDFESMKSGLTLILQSTFPDKSSFEK